MAGLKFEKSTIQRLFQEGMMRESVIYQEILQEGRQEGRQEGERSLVLRLLEQKIGTLSNSVRDRVTSLNLEKLEALALAMLNFATPSDLQAWLELNV
jgi:predicted transposase YdaD